MSGRYKYGKDGNLEQISLYDTSLMMTLKNIFPDDPELAKKYIGDAKKKDAPKGKLRDLCNARNNAELARKIFRVYLKAVVEEVVEGKCQFIFPLPSKPALYMGFLKDSLVRKRRQDGNLTAINLLNTNYKVPYPSLKLSQNTRRQHLKVYLNKKLYKKLVDRANSGKIFSKFPKEMEDFLPYIYAEFPYIKEDKIKKLIRYCLKRFMYHLKRGEEIRILDKEGEIRFFRPLGKQHDKVMRQVVNRRNSRERNKLLDKLEIKR